ncbi:MAG: LysR family transcriptional regulator [Salaquimonas sp.]
MKIRNLDTFYWVATLGSFRAASQKLNLTQPAISARIQVLEQDLGAEVFLREVRNAELTADGRKLLPYAERLMRLDQDVLSAFKESTNVEQTIRLGSSETIVATWLPDFLSHLSNSQPGLSFDLSVDATDNLRNALVAHEIDLAFLMGPVAEVSITNTDICAYEMVFAATKEFANKNKKWTLGDIASEPILTFANNTKPNRQIREMLLPLSSKPLDMTTSTSLGALIRLAKTGLGICALPKAVIASELEKEELIELPTNFGLPTIAFTASYVSGSASSALIASISKEVSTFLANRMIKNIYQI